MATKLKPVDAVIVGFGWTGAVLARELTKAGLNVLALERGGMRDTIPNFAAPMIHDELRFAIRHDLMQDASRETLTFRNNVDQTALPIRRWDRFCRELVWAAQASTGTASTIGSRPASSGS